MSGLGTPRKGGWTATVTVSVRDATESLVAGATVTGTWSTGGIGTCVTASTGSCSFATSVSRKSTSITWVVTSIAAPGYAYDGSANVGPSIVVAAP